MALIKMKLATSASDWAILCTVTAGLYCTSLSAFSDEINVAESRAQIIANENIAHLFHQFEQFHVSGKHYNLCKF